MYFLCYVSCISFFLPIDLFLTNNPTVVTSANVRPGISDHDAALIVTSTSARMHRQKPREIPLYTRADWDGLKDHIQTFHEQMTSTGQFDKCFVHQLWQLFHDNINSGIKKFIPTKIASIKNKLPYYVNSDLKRLYRKRDRVYRKHKKSGLQQDR